MNKFKKITIWFYTYISQNSFKSKPINIISNLILFVFKFKNQLRLIH